MIFFCLKIYIIDLVSRIYTCTGDIMDKPTEPTEPTKPTPVLATNTVTGERVALEIINIDKTEPGMKKILDDFANNYGWKPEDTKIELGWPPPNMKHLTIVITNTSTGKNEERQIYIDKYPSKKELKSLMDAAKRTFADENSWDIKHTKVEYIRTVPVLMRATNTATGQSIPFQARMKPDPSEETRVHFLEEIRDQIAKEYGWLVGDTEIEYSEPPLDPPVCVSLLATNTATGQCNPFMTTTTDPDAVSTRPDLQARFLTGVQSEFANAKGWNVGDTKIEYGEPLLADPVCLSLRATNTATGQCISFATTTTDPNAVSARSDLRACFLTGVKSEFAEEYGWLVGDTEIEHEEPMLV